MPATDVMRHITIVGSGAIGGTFAAELTLAGAPLTVVERSEALVKEVRRSGMRLNGIGGDRTARFAWIVTPEEFDDPVDLAVIATRSHDTDAALDVLVPHLSDTSTVVSVQNGWNSVHIADRIGADRTLACMVHLSASMRELGVITKMGAGEFHIGEVDGVTRPGTAAVAEEFSLGVDTRAGGNIWGYIWAKQIYAATFPVNALVDVPADKLYANEWVQYILLGIILEGIQAADAEGIRLETFERFDAVALRATRPEDLSVAFAALPKGSTKGNSGPYQSLKRGERTGIDSINGAIVGFGQKHGFAMELNTRLISLIHDIEDGRRTMDWANVRSLEQPAREFVDRQLGR